MHIARIRYVEELDLVREPRTVGHALHRDYHAIAPLASVAVVEESVDRCGSLRRWSWPADLRYPDHNLDNMIPLPDDQVVIDHVLDIPPGLLA